MQTGEPQSGPPAAQQPVKARPVAHPPRPRSPLELPWLRREDALLDLALVLVVALLVQFAPGITASVRGLEPQVADAGEIVLMHKATQALLVCGLLAYFILRHGIHPRCYGLRADRAAGQLGWALAALAGAYAAMLASVLIVVVALLIFPDAMQDLRRRVDFVEEITRFTHSETIALLIAVSLHEEALFRALLIPYLWRVIGRSWVAVAISSAVFASLHYHQGWIGVVQIFGVGAALGAVFVASRSLPALVIAHFVFNYLQLWLVRQFDFQQLRDILN